MTDHLRETAERIVGGFYLALRNSGGGFLDLNDRRRATNKLTDAIATALRTARDEALREATKVAGQTLTTCTINGKPPHSDATFVVISIEDRLRRLAEKDVQP